MDNPDILKKMAEYVARRGIESRGFTPEQIKGYHEEFVKTLDMSDLKLLALGAMEHTGYSYSKELWQQMVLYIMESSDMDKEMEAIYAEAIQRERTQIQKSGPQGNIA
jgi:hypothetical protein